MQKQRNKSQGNKIAADGIKEDKRVDDSPRPITTAQSHVWTKVREKLPEMFQPVFVGWRNGNSSIDKHGYGHHVGEGIFMVEGRHNQRVDYWMEIPPLPSTAERNPIKTSAVEPPPPKRSIPSTPKPISVDPNRSDMIARIYKTNDQKADAIPDTPKDEPIEFLFIKYTPTPAEPKVLMRQYIISYIQHRRFNDTDNTDYLVPTLDDNIQTLCIWANNKESAIQYAYAVAHKYNISAFGVEEAEKHKESLCH